MAQDEREQVERVARLARLELEPGEVERLAGSFERILEAFAGLRELDVGGLAPMTGPCERTDVLRADEPRPGLPPDELLRRAPERVDGFFGVPKTVRGAEDDG